MRAVPGVEDVHDLHIWSLSSDMRALSAHVILSGHPSLEQAQAVGIRVKQALSGPFRIGHATLELEMRGLRGRRIVVCHDQPAGDVGLNASPPPSSVRRTAR